MSISRIKQIKRILKEHDVRDPRGALNAIEQVVKQPKSIPLTEADKPAAEPLLQLALVRTSPKTVAVTVKFDRDKLTPYHVVKVIESLEQFGSATFDGEQCDDPDCPAHGKAAVTDLSELFEKFEEAALNKKGNLQ